MIAKYSNGTFGLGLGGGSFGAATDAFGGSGTPFNMNKMIQPLFLSAEYFNTVNNTNKQLEGTIQTLHSLRSPEHAPEMTYQPSNYNLLEQQYNNAQAKLNSTPILGTSIDQHIAQQQAIGEQNVTIDDKRIQNIAQLMDKDSKERANVDYRNASQRYQEAEAIRQHENSIKTAIQDEKDKARAIKTEAFSSYLDETNKLWQLQQERKKAKLLAEMRLQHDKGLQSEIDKEKSFYDTNLSQEFRNQFDLDMGVGDTPGRIEDDEEFKEKYGFGFDDWEASEDKYDSDIYKTAYEAYAKTKEADWNKILTDTTNQYEERWLRDWGNLYYDVLKKGGKVKDTTKNTIRRSLSMEEKIIIDNNKNLHNFVKQMNDRQTKILLKLLSL